LSREAARIAIVTAVQALKATWTDYDLTIEYGNTLIDISQQSTPFLRVTMLYHDAFQADLGPHARHRATGGVLLEALAKEGSGDKVQNQLLDHFYKGLHMSDANPPVRTYAAKFLPVKPAVNGWSNVGVTVPFWYDDIS
jgi:Bacteriophage related domain of unknown function